MDDHNLANLKEWLLGREYDISHSIEDFGQLAEIFREVVGRKVFKLE